MELHRLSTPMDQPSGSIQSRGPPASTWLNTTQRACGETPVTVCHCPDAHLQSPSGGTESAGGGSGTMEGRGACFWLTASSLLQRGTLAKCGCKKKQKVPRNPDCSEVYTACLHVYNKRKPRGRGSLMLDWVHAFTLLTLFHLISIIDFKQKKYIQP